MNTCSTFCVETPIPNPFNRSHNASPSTRSIAGAPSRVASLRASAVNVPVVNTSPLSAADHGAAKIANRRRADRALPSLALEENVKRQEIDPKHADAVDSAVATSSRDVDLDEAGLPQDFLAQPLECAGIHLEQAIQQQVLPWKLEGGGVWRLHVPDGAQIFLRLLLFLADFPFPPPPVGVV
jgi:hypothetical protein